MTTVFQLRYGTKPEWLDAVLKDFDSFLIDHAAAEKKASGMAMSMLSHYPDKHELVRAMADLAIEEMAHFREVIKIIYQRGLILSADSKDQYVNQLRKLMRQGTDLYMLDRLIIAGVIEARGCERFGLVGEGLSDPDLKQFYRAIAESEAKHERLFIDLAKHYFDHSIVDARLDELLDKEAEICAALPIISALH